MKEGWTYKKLGEVCEVTDYVANGSFATLKENVTYYNEPNYAILVRLADYSSNFDKSKFIYVDEHSYNFLSKSKLYGGEIIMSNVGSVGKCFICPNLGQPMTIGPNSVLVRTPNSQYFYYYFQSESFQNKLRTITNKATLAKFNKTQFRDIEIYFPCSSEQQRIVSRLDSAFAHIDELKANAEKQLSEAKALFQKALEKAMEPKEGWEEKTLKEITSKIGSGATPKGGKKVYINEGVSLVRSMNVHYDEFKYKDLAHINDNAADQLIGVELNSDDVLFNITGASIARCCVLPEDVLPARVNQHVSILRPIKEIILPKFLCLGLISFKHQKQLLEIGVSGSTRQAVTKSDLERHIFPIPPLKDQQLIVERLDSLSVNIRKLEDIQRKTIAECDALKQALLRKVFE